MGASAARRAMGAAPYLALLALVVGVAWYAVRSQGFQAHEPRLHDGGIWVTNTAQGYFGRMNKPIAQLDTAVAAEQNATLDVVQDGGTVLGVDTTANTLSLIDPATGERPPGQEVGLPAGGGTRVHAGGGSVATIDSTAGKVWAQRVPDGSRLTDLSLLDPMADPVAEVGANAGLAVTATGTVLAVSADEDRLVRIAPSGPAFVDPVREDLAEPLEGSPTVTAVGETPVVLDPEGALQVVGGGTASVPAGSALQQPASEADTVLVATPEALLQVDLDSGEPETVAQLDVELDAIAPVRLNGCSYAAWNGSPAMLAVQCGDHEPEMHTLGSFGDLAFRVNRGDLVLNDRGTGAVFRIDSDEPRRMDDWNAFLPQKVQDDDSEEEDQDTDGDRRPPRAHDDVFGARPGRTTVLYPLDNDQAPDGRLLVVRSIGKVRGDARVTLSPDGQTVQVQLPEDARRTTFEYTVDDGREGMSDTATVVVEPRSEKENGAPSVREGYEQPAFFVPAAGVLEMPVLPDWRDPADGDPLTLLSARVLEGPEGAVARATTGGRVRLTAANQGAQVKVEYSVTDGVVSEPVTGILDVTVQAPDDPTTHAPVAEPDVVTGVAGESITINPLANDIAGSDPLSPQAELRLAGNVAHPEGGEVETDLIDGTLTFTTSVPQTYFLEYDAEYGDAEFGHGMIRVDVRDDDKDRRDPVAMPDNAIVYGQGAAMIDPLANDIDPAGRVLVVQKAVADDPTQLDVTVVSSRWIRITPRTSDLTPNPQVVRYTLSNGTVSDVEGQVIVSQRDEVEDPTPVTEPDRVTVRAGSTVTVPVLDNDFSPGGGPLHLVDDVADAQAGKLPVVAVGDDQTNLGEAWVTGGFVRYLAPAEVNSTRNLTLTYLAADDNGIRSPGTVEVQVVPDKPNQVPEPPVLEGRVVSGSVVTLRLPETGVDPDGDPVTITGLTEAPRFGRIVEQTGNSLRYEAFPGGFGTDEFRYEVTDTRGGLSTGLARVGVAPPTVPEPPQAVDDLATGQQGRTVLVDVLANDRMMPGDAVALTLVEPVPAGVTTVGDNLISMPAPEGGTGSVVEAVYRLDNGVRSTQGTVTLQVVDDYNNPPVVYDAFAARRDNDRAVVDVLEDAYDPDGETSGLQVVRVLPPPGVDASVEGRQVSVARGDTPLVVPFEVQDAEGAVTTASLYVPPRSTPRPTARPDALIRVEAGGTTRIDLEQVVESPDDDPLQFTLRKNAWGAPEAGVNAVITGPQSAEVQALPGYAGPAAVSFEVIGSDEVDDPDAPRAVVTVPVQVGESVPILHCPSDPVRLPQGETIQVDIASTCHVWSPDGAPQQLTYEGSWETTATGVVLDEPRGPVLAVRAGGDAAGGQAPAELRVTVPGTSATGVLPVQVVAVPPPTMEPVHITDLRSDSSRTIDLTPYLSPSVREADPQILAVEAQSALDVDASFQGTDLTLRVAPGVNGRAVFRVEMSDVGGEPPPERRTEARLVVDVQDRPGVPTGLTLGRTVRSHEVLLAWTRPSPNGSPIDRYRVKVSGGGTRECTSTPCSVGGLTNGQAYRFQVQAHNAVGWSDLSAWSPRATPDARPGMVGPIRLARVGNGSVTLAWSPPATQTSAIKRYHISYPGGRTSVGGRQHTTTIGGLNNNVAYRFSVTAENQRFLGATRRSEPFQSSGTPVPPGAPRLSSERTASNTGAVGLAWNAVAPNGPGPATYTVLRGGRPLARCRDLRRTACEDVRIPYDGTVHTYSVRVCNQPVRGVPGGQSKCSMSGGSRWAAVGIPANWGNVTLTPTGANFTARAQFTVPDSHGGASNVRVLTGTRVLAAWNGIRGAQTREVKVPNNDTTHRLVFEVCNEARECTRSAATPVQTYGPLATAHIIGPRTSQGLDYLWVSGQVDGNGKAVTVTVSVAGQTAWTRTFPGVDRSSFVTGKWRVGYGKRVTPVVTISSAGRGSPRANSTTVQTISTPAVTGIGKYDANRVAVALANFPGRATCRATGPAPNGGLAGLKSLVNGYNRTGWAYGRGGATITVTCTASQNGHTQNFARAYRW